MSRAYAIMVWGGSNGADSTGLGWVHEREGGRSERRKRRGRRRTTAFRRVNAAVEISSFFFYVFVFSIPQVPNGWNGWGRRGRSRGAPTILPFTPPSPTSSHISFIFCGRRRHPAADGFSLSSLRVFVSRDAHGGFALSPAGSGEGRSSPTVRVAKLRVLQMHLM